MRSPYPCVRGSNVPHDWLVIRSTSAVIAKPIESSACSRAQRQVIAEKGPLTVRQSQPLFRRSQPSPVERRRADRAAAATVVSPPNVPFLSSGGGGIRTPRGTQDTPNG